MTRQPPPRQPYAEQPYYEEEEYYDESRGSKVSPAMIVSIVLGGLALVMLISMLVMWSKYSTAESKLRTEMATNAERHKKNQELKTEKQEIRRKIKLAENEAVRTRGDRTAEALAKAAPGSAAYWKARYEDAEREKKGHEMQAKKSRRAVESNRGGKKPPTPAPTGSMGVPGT